MVASITINSNAIAKCNKPYHNRLSCLKMVALRWIGTCFLSNPSGLKNFCIAGQPVSSSETAKSIAAATHAAVRIFSTGSLVFAALAIAPRPLLVSGSAIWPP